MNDLPATEQDRAAIVACHSFGTFLVAPDLKAVKQLPSTPICVHKTKSNYDTGDAQYMSNLSGLFEGSWGAGPDDLSGYLTGILDEHLKR